MEGIGEVQDREAKVKGWTLSCLEYVSWFPAVDYYRPISDFL